MPDRNPDENPDDEGLPDVQSHPPGIDVETDAESAMLPRDHAIAAGSDPAYPVTGVEQARGESVAERAAREEPDFGERPADPGAADGMAPEEAAVHDEGG